MGNKGEIIMRVGMGIYVRNSVEAVDFYLKIFGLELGYHVKNPDGSYYHSELNKDGKEILSVVEGKGISCESIIQLGIEFETIEEVQRVYKAFCDDGAKIDIPICELPWSPCAASVIDRFGVWWYFSALSHYPKEELSKDQK